MPSLAQVRPFICYSLLLLTSTACSCRPSVHLHEIRSAAAYTATEALVVLVMVAITFRLVCSISLSNSVA